MSRRRRPRQAKPQDTFVLIVILGVLALLAIIPTFNPTNVYIGIIIAFVAAVIVTGIYYFLVYRKQRAQWRALLALEREQIDLLSGTQFEELVARVLHEQGYSIRTTRITGDYGVDLIATKDGIKTAVQCKRYSKPIDQKAVREAVAGMAHYKCQRSMVVTNSTFTASAIILARSNGCTLVDREELGRWLAESRNLI